MTEGNFPVWQHLFESPIGWIGLYLDQGLVWTLAMGCVDPKRCQSHLVKESKHLKVDVFEADLPGKVKTFARKVEKDIQDFLKGGHVDLSEVPVHVHATTPFQEKVLRACHAIPRGKTLTYQQLAASAGSPRAYRAVGNIMAKNKVPLLIPCHRVISCGGRMGGFSAPQGINLKERLLKLEAAS